MFLLTESLSVHLSVGDALFSLVKSYKNKFFVDEILLWLNFNHKTEEDDKPNAVDEGNIPTRVLCKFNIIIRYKYDGS